jgi:hypothetical protein
VRDHVHCLEFKQQIPIHMRMEVSHHRHISALLLSASGESHCNVGTHFSNAITARCRVSDIQREDMWLSAQLASSWMRLKE